MILSAHKGSVAAMTDPDAVDQVFPDVDEADLKVTHQKDWAAGVPGVAVAMKTALTQMGPIRSAKTLLKLNQKDGFDCMSCAWPDPDHRHTAEFCENGAKAVSHEGNKKRVTPQFFAEHSLDQLRAHDDYWLGMQGRITHPMVKQPGATHYSPIEWDDAFALIARHLSSIEPDEAIFYTSGRASNEAAFVYQLFVRAYGTNNLPDCSNMCHESTSVALAEAIGIGKASVRMSDVYDADLLVIAGQNPGTNHPRMLSALEIAKHRGAKIIAINPLNEPGLMRFKNPQKPKGVIGDGVQIADLHLPVKLNGDLALFQGIAALLLEQDALDRAFIDEHTTGFAEWREHLRALDWALVEQSSGLTKAQIAQAAQMIAASRATIYFWAMGLTQHRNAVNTIRELCNLAFLRGDIGKKGAGLFPVRGHSNVQGDRTMGIWERPPERFLDSLATEFGFEPPREHGHDVVDSIRALRDGKASFFLGLGGNFVDASPDTDVTYAALSSAALTVQISTTLNRSHLITGDTALILPTLGRTETDVQASGPQEVTVEDSVCAVHASHGPLAPASEHLRSEVAILTGVAEATLGDRFGINWSAMRDNYDVIRDHISRVVAGCENYSERAKQPGGFTLPHPPRDSRTFPTKSGKAEFLVAPIEVMQVPDKHLVLQTLRSHDQFNTTIYGLDDRYRGIHDGRRVIFIHREDIAMLGFEPGDMVDLITHWEADEIDRVARDFRIVEYATPRGSAAAYYPETNPLIPLDSTAEGSNTPTSKAVVIRLVPAGSTPHRADADGQAEVGADDSHKARPEPVHLS